MSISSVGRGTGDVSGGRSKSESTSRPALHNALRGLEPEGHPVGPRFFPALRHGREPSLLAFALEAEPAAAVFAGDGDASSERSPPPLRRTASIVLALIGGAVGRRGTAVSAPSLGRGRRHQPYLPPLARRVDKRPIAHRQVLRRLAPPSLCSALLLCTAGARIRVSRSGFSTVNFLNVRILVGRSRFVAVFAGVGCEDVRGDISNGAGQRGHAGLKKCIGGNSLRDSRRDGREAEGTGLLNRHTWKHVSRVRIPLSPLGGSAHPVWIRFSFLLQP